MPNDASRRVPPGAPPITEDLVEKLVDTTGRAERSVLRRLVGLPVRGRAGTCIDQALAELGLLPPVTIIQDDDDAKRSGGR